MKNENTGKTEASQRIMISSSNRLTIVTSTISLIFSEVDVLANSPSNRQFDLALQRTREPGRIDHDNQRRDPEQDAKADQEPVGEAKGVALEEQANPTRE